MVGLRDLGFRVDGAGISVKSLRLRFTVWGSGFDVQCKGFNVQDVGFRVEGLGSRV